MRRNVVNKWNDYVQNVYKNIQLPQKTLQNKLWRIYNIFDIKRDLNFIIFFGMYMKRHQGDLVHKMVDINCTT